MMTEQIEQEGGVAGIVLGAGGAEGAAVGGRHGRGNGVENQVVVLAEHVDDGAALLLQGDGDGPSRELTAEGGNPKLDGFGSVFQFAGLDRPASGWDQRPGVVLRAPVDSRERGADGFGQWGRKLRHANLQSRRAGLVPAKVL
jgi:hypothetical protein